MRRYSPPYRSPPRRGYGSRGRSPPRRGYGGRKESGSVSLLVRNIPLSCRPEDLRGPFERFGPVRDVYLPKDYYSGEPRGFAFIEFVDPYDASEAQYHMNRQLLFGREVTVVLAAESRKRPEDMRRRDRIRGPSGYEGRRSNYHRHSRSRSRSRSVSRSRSPQYRSRRSRTRSPAPRRRDDLSASPRRKESHHAKSPRSGIRSRGEDSERRSRSYSHDSRDNFKRSYSPEREEKKRRSYSPVSPDRKRSYSPEAKDPKRRSYSPIPKDAGQHKDDNGFDESPARDGEAYGTRMRSPREESRSPPGSRSRSVDTSGRRSN